MRLAVFSSERRLWRSPASLVPALRVRSGWIADIHARFLCERSLCFRNAGGGTILKILQQARSAHVSDLGWSCDFCDPGALLRCNMSSQDAALWPSSPKAHPIVYVRAGIRLRARSAARFRSSVAAVISWLGDHLRCRVAALSRVG